MLKKHVKAPIVVNEAIGIIYPTDVGIKIVCFDQGTPPQSFTVISAKLF
jgi:hypothetical protein